MTMRILRTSLSRPGKAKTSVASRETSRSVRTLGNFTDMPISPVESASSRNSGRAAPIASFSQPRALSHPLCMPMQRARISLQKGEIGAVAADRDVRRQRSAARNRSQSLPDQGGLAVTPRGNEEDLLARGQIAHEPVELVDAVDERRRRHHLAVDKWIFHYVVLRNGYVL